MIQGTLKSKIDEDVCLMIQFLNHGYYYLCDCGFASDISVREAKNVQGFFISHTHIDHFCNFDAIMRHQLPLGRQVIICGPENIGQNVQSKLRAYNWNLISVEDQVVSYQVREVLAKNQIRIYELKSPNWELKTKGNLHSEILYENEVFKVRYALLDHGTPVLAYLFEEHPVIKLKESCPLPSGAWVRILKDCYLNSKPDITISIEQHGTFQASELFIYLEEKQVFKLGYVMDHAISEENHRKIIELCQGADELYIEAFYRNDEWELANKNKHSTAQASGEVARLANVKKLIPMHFSRRHQSENARKELLYECMRAFEGV
jgi:ribonuclease Z